MIDRTLARRYALAVFSLATERDAIARIGDELQCVNEVFERDANARQFFLAPVIARSDKERVLAKVFERRIGDVVLHTLLLLVRKRREALLPALVDEYRALQMAERGTETLTIASARPLTEKQVTAMSERLERIYGKRFEPRVVVDPSLVGGVRVTMGDRLVDGTVAGRLDEMARSLETATV